MSGENSNQRKTYENRLLELSSQLCPRASYRGRQRCSIRYRTTVGNWSEERLRLSHLPSASVVNLAGRAGRKPASGLAIPKTVKGANSRRRATE